MSHTFAQLGIPFPLFEAPTADAGEYAGVETCSLCGRSAQHCFRLDIGCALIIHCPKCGSENGLDASERENAPCRQCGTLLKFPQVADEVLTCYVCLRAGKAAITKDTEPGMVSWEQAFDGVTHGTLGLDRRDFDMVPKEDDWVGARLPREMMDELLRTPTYTTIQGERWQFCCRSPMLFVGSWSREEFTKRSPNGDGKRFFEDVVQDVVPGLWEDKLHDVTGVYV